MSLRPTAGVRLVVTQVPGSEGAAYVGHAHLPERDVPLSLVVDASTGKVAVTVDVACAVEDGLRSALEDAAARLVRAGTKGPGPRPRKIRRWRAL